MRVAVTKLGSGTIRVMVTSRVASVGPNESIVATPPVFRATVRRGHKTAFTNRTGVAIIKARHRGTLTVTAGNTLEPTSVSGSK